MAKRSYHGPSIDGTEQHISERPGKTVAGSSKDAEGDERTTLSEESDTELQKRIKTALINRPKASLADIANEVGCSRHYVHDVKTKTGLKNRRSKKDLADMSEKQRRIIEMHASKNNLTQKDISDWNNVSEAYVSQLIQSNGHLIERLRNTDE